MIDVQNQADNRNIKIRQTGIAGVYLPMIIFNQNVLAKIKFTMSRLSEILTDHANKPTEIFDLKKILSEAIDKLETDFAAIEIAFKFFVNKIAPVSARESLLDVDCKFIAELAKNSDMKFILALKIPFTSLCPCSKEISDFGAHNQRSICKVRLEFKNISDIKIFDIIDLIENQGSAKIYPVLKREDEKFVTEAAYQNPKFVEDILRDTVIALRGDKNISAFEIECENFESIHNHSAFAYHKEIC